MTEPRRVAVFGLAFLMSVPAVASAWQDNKDPLNTALEAIRPEAIRAHMRFLADDLLEGRGTGTRGYDLAARYVAAHFESLGLEPAGPGGSYYQTVPLREIRLVPEESSLVLMRGGKSEPLTLQKDFLMFGSALHTETQVEAPLVFAGYGVTATERGYDDYAGVDVRGKIVALLSGAPPSFPSAERAHFSSRVLKAENAARRGAVGMLFLRTQKDEQVFPWAAAARMSRQPSLRWLSPDGTPNDVQPEIRGGAWLSREVSGSLFSGAPKGFSEALASADRSEPQAFPLPVTVRIRTSGRHAPLESPNVLAVLRGSDPRLRDEYVVYTAHLDHEGIGEPRDGDSIYNGALDNASGVAQMLEVARAFTRLAAPPRRSVLFLAVTAEEHGLLGSDYFARYPTVPAAQIVANVNLDGGAILYSTVDVVAHGAEHSSLGGVVQRAAKRLGLELSPDPAPEQTFFIRSDQYSFVKQGIPAVFIFPGMRSADPGVQGASVFQNYLDARYHSPQDDMSQTFSFEAGATGARLNFLIGYDVAQQEDRPRWNPGDFFGRTFGHAR